MLSLYGCSSPDFEALDWRYSATSIKGVVYTPPRNHAALPNPPSTQTISVAERIINLIIPVSYAQIHNSTSYAM